MNKSSVFHSDPEILGGTVVFIGTRVPLQNLVDYLEGGYTLDEFLDDFPSVTREQAARLQLKHPIESPRFCERHVVADALGGIRGLNGRPKVHPGTVGEP